MRFLLLVICLFAFLKLSAKGYYVSPSGSDLNKGNHWFTPFKTLLKAATSVLPGDTVYILKGDYYSDDEAVLEITKSGLENSWIVFKNYRNHKPVLHIRNKYGIHLKSVQYISIEGLEINAEMKIGSNYPVSKFQTIGIFLEGSYNAPLNSVKIYNNFIQNVSAEAILANYFDKLTISFNKFYNNTRNPESKGTLALLNGIYTESNTNYHNFIQGNTFEKNGMSDTILKSSCIPAIYMNLETNQVFRESAKTLIHNNILYTNHGGGFIANNVHGLQLVNNTFYKNSENKICQNAEVVLIGSKFIDLFNNIFYSSDLKPGSQAFGTSNINAKNNLYYNTTSFIPGINNIHANPDFENIRIKEGLFNFKLKGSSPAINKGLDSLLSDTDFEGNIRKLDLHVDIGAMEFTNRLLPSLKKLRLGPGTKGIKTKWISLYTKDQKMYTIWNEQFLEFTVRVFDLQGNILAHKTPRISGDSSYEIDFSKFRTGYYTILAFNESGNYIERLYVK